MGRNALLLALLAAAGSFAAAQPAQGKGLLADQVVAREHLAGDIDGDLIPACPAGDLPAHVGPQPRKDIGFEIVEI